MPLKEPFYKYLLLNDNFSKMEALVKHRSIPLLEAWGDFSHASENLILWESGRAPGNKTHKCSTPVFPTHHDWVPLEFLNVRIVHTEPPAIRQFQFGVSYCSWFSCQFLCMRQLRWVVTPSVYLSDSSVLEIAVWTVSSPLLWIQEELLILQSVQSFICC